MKTIFRNLWITLQRFRLASTLNIAGLGVAFGAFVLILAQVDYERSFDRFHPAADRIYRVEICSPRRNIPLGNYAPTLPYPLAEAIRSTVPQVERVAVVDGRGRTLNVAADRAAGERTVYEEHTREITPSFLTLFDMQLTEGRGMTLDRTSALIPASLARKFFGSESAVWRQLAPAETDSLIGWRPEIRVGGVYRDFPANSIFANDIYLPMDDRELDRWDRSNYHIYLRLAPGASADEVARTIDRIEYPNRDEQAELRLMPITGIYYARDLVQDNAPKGNRASTRILMAIALLVVGIAAVNFVNFSLALAPVRMRGINTRKILGSSVAALRGALIAEAVVMTVGAYVLALGAVWYIGRSPFADSLAGAATAFRSVGVLILGGAVALLTGVAAGIYPAVYTTSFPPALAVKGNFGLSPKGRALRNVLVGFQFSVSMALIIGAAFMNLQNSYLAGRPIGMNRGGVVEVPLSKRIFINRHAFFGRLADDPAVNAAALTEAPMFRDRYDNFGLNFRGETINFGNLGVTSAFTELMEIRIFEGRGFVEGDDRAEGGTRAIFNRTARQAYGLELGDRLDFGPQQIEVIGFMEDANFESLHKSVGPFALTNIGAGEWSYLPTAYVRLGAGDPTETLKRLGGWVAELDPTAVVDVHFLDETVEAQYRNDRRMGNLITLFSLLAAVISLAGVFGLVVFETQYRRKEIGVRKVMGATVSEILGMFNRQFVWLVGICFVVAAPLAWYGVREWLATFAYRTPIYWWVFLVSLLIVLFITLLTVTVQSWRAATANPVDALKAE